ncbi:sacsin N-terminal ATP-binding-like domain-containing protein [Lacinutrix sp. MEBiC02404]
MTKLSETGITDLIERYKATYLGNPSILLSGYSQENQTVADYEGRQLLELMQNADDAKSDVVYIALDTQKQELTVSNNGEPFSLDGVESLMYTGLSTKNKFEYIGNKGLGFRSILSWVNWVEVRTRDVSFRFSKDYSVSFYERYLQGSPLIQARIVKEIAEQRLLKNEIPIATLAFPELLKDKEAEYITSVILQFKEGQLEPILEQLEKISEETLLFLPNIRKIVVVKDGETVKELHKTVDAEQLITVNDKTWNVYRKKDQVYKDNVKFNYAIAWQDKMEDAGYFYNYFKTDVPTSLPCIIHATFNLTNNRKEINNSVDNTYILDRIVESLGEIVTTRLKKETPDWDAYSFLTPLKSNSRDHFKNFYKTIEAKREDISCYPTVDGEYLSKDKIVYQGDEFTNWVQENEFGAYFHNLLLPIASLSVFIPRRYSFLKWETIIKELNPHLDLENRVALIQFFVETKYNYFDNIKVSETKLSLLLNTKDEVVPSAIQVFTNDVKDLEYNFPNHLKNISFISHDLYELIKKELSEEIPKHRRDNESGDSRAIKRLLESIVNIGSDDINVVIQYIIRKTNQVKTTASYPKGIVMEMVELLFSIFNSNKDRRGNLSTLNNIPLISRSGRIVNSEDLYFGKDYANGVFCEQIFDGIRTAEHYLASNKIWELEADEENIINFFKWLNVNLYSKYEIIEKQLGRWESDKYVDFIFKYLKPNREDIYKTYSIESVTGIEDVLVDENFTLEKLIAWISKDVTFLEKLRLNNTDKFVTKFGVDPKDYIEKPSYLSFLISKSGITNNVIAEIPGGHLDNIQSVNFKHPLLVGLQNYKILEILDLLHIKSSFNELQPEHVYSLLRDFGNFDNVKKSQQVYKLFYEYFKVNEETQLKDYDLELDAINYVCRKGGLGNSFEIKPNSEVYYSDNKMLPQKILDRYWFINLPKRIGENRVQTFFGVKLIKDVSSNIQTSGIEDNKLNTKLESYINQLKVYLLCYRLGSQKKEDSKEEIVRNIKAFKVQLVKKAKFKLGDEAYSELEDCEFIPQDKAFLIKYGKERDLKDLQNDRFFCDAITEMLCITFKVNDLKDIFWRIFKNGIADAKHNLISDEKSELLEEAKKLLGISNDEKFFWNKILKRDLSSIEDAELLKKEIENELGVALPEFYSHVEFINLGNIKGVVFLKWLQLKKDFDLSTVLKDADLFKYHQGRLEDVIRDMFPVFEKLLWAKANASNDNRDKKEFFKRLGKLEPPINTGAFKKFLKENQYHLEPNYKHAVSEYILSNFSVDLKEIPDNNLLIETKYKTLFNSYTFGIDIEDMEKIIKADTPEVYSLFYFEGFDKEIKIALDAQQADKVKEVQGEADADNDDASNLILIESDILCTEPSGTGKSGGKGGSHTSKGERKKAVAGKKEENKVIKALKANGYQVRPVSKTTDSKHYDIEYKKADEAWRFLEVKKDSGGYFYMSIYEKQTAVSDAIREKYDVAIVNQNNIHIIKNPFNFKDEETFDMNSKFNAESTEFKINFKVNNKDN